MRLVFALLAAVAAGCSTSRQGTSCPPYSGGFSHGTSTFLDTDDDGLPDTRVEGPAYLDTDDDGLPDTRVAGIGAAEGQARPHRITLCSQWSQWAERKPVRAARRSLLALSTIRTRLDTPEDVGAAPPR